MEDSVPEAESLLHQVEPSSRDGVEEEKVQVDNKEGGAKGGEEKASGFINHLISNLVAADEPDKESKEEHDNHEEKEIVDEERGGGLLDHLISNLVSPLSPKAGEISQGEGEVFNINENDGSRSEQDVVNIPAGGGGLIKNVIYNLFHPSEADQVTEFNSSEEEKVKIAEENVKTEENGGGVSIIDNIVSHLSTPLREDVAPTPDEASILIHSIIHD